MWLSGRLAIGENCLVAKRFKLGHSMHRCVWLASSDRNMWPLGRLPIGGNHLAAKLFKLVHSLYRCVWLGVIALVIAFVK